MSKVEDLTGQRFGRLVVIKRGQNTKGDNKPTWICQCDCGNIKTIRASGLKGGTSSCGCLMRERQIEYMHTRKGKLASQYKHGLSHSRINGIYRQIKGRCFRKTNPAFPKYGGRGITICDDWLGDNGFINFYNWSMDNGYADNLTLDRINTDGNYEPSNCRWADWIVQQNNRTNNINITHNGETHTLSEWARLKNIRYGILLKRYKRGWNPYEMLNYPKGTRLKDIRKSTQGEYQ